MIKSEVTYSIRVQVNYVRPLANKEANMYSVRIVVMLQSQHFIETPIFLQEKNSKQLSCKL